MHGKRAKETINKDIRQILSVCICPRAPSLQIARLDYKNKSVFTPHQMLMGHFICSTVNYAEVHRVREQRTGSNV